MKAIEGLKYSKEHEWIKVEDSKAYIGITDYAQRLLGELVYVELPELDAQIQTGDTLSVVESVKAASDIFSPVSGKVVEINDQLADEPEKINESPYESWIAAILLDDMHAFENLMDAAAYEKFCNKEA